MLLSIERVINFYQRFGTVLCLGKEGQDPGLHEMYWLQARRFHAIVKWKMSDTVRITPAQTKQMAFKYQLRTAINPDGAFRSRDRICRSL